MKADEVHGSVLSYPVLLERFKALLKTNGLKFTKQREVILETLFRYEGHFTPEELYRLIGSRYPDMKIGIATIYRTLSLLENEGMVTSISFGSRGKKYELGTKAHHDHLICTECGKILEFYDEAIEKKQEKIAEAFGFAMQDHTLKIYGICPDCQNQAEKEKKR